MKARARSRFRGGRAVGLILLAGALASAGGAAADPVDDARALMLAGDRAEARARLDSLLASPAPDRTPPVEARLLRARLEDDGEAYAAALRDLLVSEEDPVREATLRLALGQVLFARGSMEDALVEFRRVRELGREETGSLWAGLTAFVLGDGPAAREALERAAASGNRSVRQRALVALGDTERLTGACNDAVGHYREAREVDNGARGWVAAAAWAEALCRDEMGERDRAVTLLVGILHDAPDSYEAPLARARLLEWTTPAPELAPEPAEEESAPAGPAPFGGYAVQIGAFTLPDNANSLAEAVQGRGFAPVRVVHGDDDLNRVLVGRFETREEAEAFGDSLGITLGVGFSVVASEGD